VRHDGADVHGRRPPPVFLTDDAFTESKGAASVTFPTTAQTKTRNTGAF
jgi:hypothetical protein